MHIYFNLWLVFGHLIDDGFLHQNAIYHQNKAATVRPYIFESARLCVTVLPDQFMDAHFVEKIHFAEMFSFTIS